MRCTLRKAFEPSKFAASLLGPRTLQHASPKHFLQPLNALLWDISLQCSIRLKNLALTLAEPSLWLVDNLRSANESGVVTGEHTWCWLHARHLPVQQQVEPQAQQLQGLCYGQDTSLQPASQEQPIRWSSESFCLCSSPLKWERFADQSWSRQALIT